MRLVTRPDFDGLACAALLKRVERIDSVEFVRSGDLLDGTLQVTSNDILANVPFVPGCRLWFDHHASEVERIVGNIPYHGDCRMAPSTTRIVYDYYDGRAQFGRYPHITELVDEVDRACCANFTRDDILNPSGWPLLSFVLDSSNGLGRFQDYRINHSQLMLALIDAFTTMSITGIIGLPDVQERVSRYFSQDVLFRFMMCSRTETSGNIILTDLRGVEPVYPGNRLLVFALYPHQNTSIWIGDGLHKQKCVFACGHSIVNRTAVTDIGALLREYGGSGHRSSGTLHVPHDVANLTLNDLLLNLATDARICAHRKAA